MKRYDKITILRNRHRVRDLRRFRDLVETYFDQVEYGTDGLPVDWEGTRVARSHINQMLPRVMQIVGAAGLGVAPLDTTDPGPRLADPDVIRNIFSARYADGADQEILDVIDMAMGVYEASRFNAFARTFNPFYYVVTALGFVAGLPGRSLKALGLVSRGPRAPRIRPEDIARLEAVASRLANVEALIETRFTDLRGRQAHQFQESARLLEELAERVDFAERMLAQQPPVKRLEAPGNEISTPA